VRWKNCTSLALRLLAFDRLWARAAPTLHTAFASPYIHAQYVQHVPSISLESQLSRSTSLYDHNLWTSRGLEVRIPVIVWFFRWFFFFSIFLTFFWIRKTLKFDTHKPFDGKTDSKETRLELDGSVNRCNL
jgi:hypothetical protein